MKPNHDMETILLPKRDPGTTNAGRNGKRASGNRITRGLIFSLGTLVTATALSSCGTKHVYLKRTQLASEAPIRYEEVATAHAMSSSIPEVFDDGPAIKGQMLKLINSAQDYILIDTFLLSVDSTTGEVIEALCRKHREGVRIHVLVDSSSRHMPGGKQAFEYLEDAGIPTVEYNPMRIYKLIIAPVMLPRDHRKFWIVDGKTLFLGGANLYFTSLNPTEHNGNRDFMVSVQSAGAISRMIESFVATWNHSSEEQLSRTSFEVRASKSEATKLWLSDQNKHAGRKDEVARMFEGLFAVAEREIWLIQPYTFVTTDMLRQFHDLKARGVSVNVMLSGKVQSPRFHYASHFGIKDMLAVGAKVWVYQPEHGPLHAKAVVVDGRWASIGSANLNARSYHLSKEANLVFGDQESVGRVMRTLNELKKGCRQVTPAEARRYRGPNYYLTWLMMQVVG